MVSSLCLAMTDIRCIAITSLCICNKDCIGYPDKYGCPICNFTAQFESVLKMHQQLHHGSPPPDINTNRPCLPQEKSNTVPRTAMMERTSGNKEKKGFQLSSTSSATRLFSKLRARISRSRGRLFSHPEESCDVTLDRDITEMSDCTSKGLNFEAPVSETSAVIALDPSQQFPLSPARETYGCHLCSFETDRITVLDRHLLNDHKIGLETLLKLVLAKTKDGLAEDDTSSAIYGIKQPYYKASDDVIEDGEFLIETTTPKIKILKNTGTNTDLRWTDIPDLKDNCRIITKELEKLIKYPLEKTDKNTFLRKMETLNDCMCKFADSSNTLKKVIDSKISVKQERNEHFLDLGLGDRDSPKDWKRAHSEQMDRSGHKHRDNRSDKKFSSESFYF